MQKSGGTRRSWRVWGVGSPNVGSGIRHFLAPSKEPHCNTVSENKLDRLGLSRSLRLQESEMAENPDFLLLETLFSPSARAASSVPPASSPMPVQATTYTFNSPLLPTLNKDNVLMFGGDAGASSPGPAQPSAAEDDDEAKEPSNPREKKSQSGARTAPALACCPAKCRLFAGH